MNFINKNLYKFILIAFVICLPIFSFAQQNANGTNPSGSNTSTPTNCDPSAGKICNPISVSSLDQFIQIVLQGVIKIGIPIIALAVIYSGFLFVKAQGNPGELEVAQKSLMYTLIGAAILLGAWAIAQVIANTVLAL